MGGEIIGVEFECSKFLTLIDGGCFWVDHQQITLPLMNANVIPSVGATIVLKAGTLKQECGDECHCYATNVESSAVLEAPEDTTATALTQGPEVAAVCEGVVVDGLQSSGGGGQPLEFAWTVSGTNEDAEARSTAQTAIDRASQFLTFESSELEIFVDAGWTSFIVELTVTNFFGSTDLAEPLEIQLSAAAIPTVEIIGGESREVQTKDTLSVQALAAATACDGRSLEERSVDYEWSIIETTTRRRLDELSSVSKDPRLFKLPPYTLGGMEYIVRVLVRDTLTGAENSASTKITLVAGQVIASIAGGDRGVSLTSDEVTLSAAGSTDDDVPDLTGNAAGLEMTWTCLKIPSEDPCDLSLTSSSDEISFPGTSLGAEGLYRFSVIATAQDGRTDEASVDLLALTDPRPLVFLDGPIGTTPAHLKTRVTAKVDIPDVSNDGEVTTTWSVVSGDFVGQRSFNDVITTPVEKVGGKTFDLVIREAQMIPGAAYTFRLDARHDGLEDAGFAEITVVASRLPTGGSIVVEPSQGIALDTRFTCIALDWAADELPLTYAFSALVDETETTLRKASLDPLVELVLLQEGDVTVRVAVVDNLGSRATADTVVQVEPFNDDITVAVTTMLDQAFALSSYEQVCQVVVAAATYSTDSTMIVTLLTNLEKASLIEDTDSASITQASAALRAPIAAAEETLSADAALAALQLAQTYSEDAQDVGLDPNAATDLVAVLADVLASDLFDDSTEAPIETLYDALEDVATAQSATVVVDEVTTGVCQGDICTAVQKISEDQLPNSIIEFDDMDAFAIIAPTTADDDRVFEIFLYDFHKDPHGGDVATDVVRFQLALTGGRRRLDESSQQRVDIAVPLLDDVIMEDDVATLEIACPSGYVGILSEPCPVDDTITIEVPCDGEESQFSVTCGTKTAAKCVGWSDAEGDWSDKIGDCQVKDQTATHVTCDCEVSPGATTDFSTVTVEETVSLVIPKNSDSVACDQITLPSPPTLADAIFDSTGASAIITFDSLTDQAAIDAGVSFVCSDIFNFPSSDLATCQWTDPGTVFADVSQALGLIPYVDINLLPNVLQAACVAYCDCRDRNGPSMTAIRPPSPPVVPIPIIQGPTTAAACEGFSLDSAQSTGAGGRRLTAVIWNATLVFAEQFNTTAPNATWVARRALHGALLRHRDDPIFTLWPGEAQKLARAGVVSLGVTLELWNFLLGFGISKPYPVGLTTEAIPQISIVGGLTQRTRRPQTLAIKVTAIATSCDDRPLAERSVSYAWDLISIDDQRTGLNSTSSDPRLFKLPPYSLDVGEYRLTAFVTDNALGVSTSTTSTIIVLPSSVVAVVPGGDRVVPLASTIQLSAAASYDEDVLGRFGTHAGLNFFWTCDDCEIDSTLETLRFDGNLLGPGSFIFRVNVSSSDGRWDTTSVQLEVVDSDPPRVTLEPVPQRVTTNARLIAKAQVGPSSLSDSIDGQQKFNSTWRLSRGQLTEGRPLATWARTPTHLATLAEIRRHDLVLPSESLVAGASYTLVLEATLGLTNGYASISFDVSRPPSAGHLVVTPEYGVALETSFDLRTTNWVSEDLPLTYTFKIQVNGSVTTLRGATRETSLDSAIFPEGDVTAIVIAQDVLGGQGSAVASVHVDGTDLTADALYNATFSLLETATALRSNEGVCQAVVAAGGNASSELAGLLVASVGAVVASQDPDVDLVEQTAAALTSTVSNLDLDSAARALDLVDAMSSTSSIIGVTTTSSNAITETLSSLLTSPLFVAVDVNTSKVNATAALALGSAVDSLSASVLLGSVANEDPTTLRTANLKVASQRVSDSSATGPRSLDVSALSRAELPITLGADADVTFAEATINPYRPVPGGDVITSSVFRFGLTTTDRRRLTLEDTTHVVDLVLENGPSSEDDDLGNNASSSYAGNVTCLCDVQGNVSMTCPDGTVLTKFCDGMPGTYTLRCPSPTTGCRVWDGTQWSGTYCYAVSTGPATTCRCEISANTAADAATTNELTDAAAAYVANVDSVDPERALYMIITLSSLIGLCCILIVAGRRLDRYDASRRHDPTTADEAMNEKSNDIAPVGGGPATSPREIRSLKDALVWTLEKEHMENQLAPRPTTTPRKKALAAVHAFMKAGARHRNHQEPTPPDKKNDNVPVFFSQRTLDRFWLAFKYEHPIFSWYLVYSQTVPRPIRVIPILAELVLLMFSLALEVLLLYPNPSCEEKLSKKDCLRLKAGWWRNGETMCLWEQCNCFPNMGEGGAGSSTSPSHYALLAAALVLTLPIVKVYEYLFENYCIAPVPPALVKFLNVFRNKNHVPTTGGGGGPAQPEDDDLNIVIDEKDAPEKDHPPTIPEDDDVLHIDELRIDDDDDNVQEWLDLGTYEAAAVEERHATYAKRLKRRSRVFRKANLAFQAQVAGRMLKLYKEKNEDVHVQARRMAPAVVATVTGQLEELDGLYSRLRLKKTRNARRAAHVVHKLASQVRRRWDWHSRYDEFLRNVEKLLVKELERAHAWAEEIRHLRLKTDDPDELKTMCLYKVHEFERLERMTTKERAVMEACVDRLDFGVDPPEEAPPLGQYLLAWLLIVGMTSALFFVLLAFSSTLGKAQTKLWLYQVIIAAFLVYCIILPIEIFFFYIWVPSLILERLFLSFPGRRHKFPFKSQTPSSLRFLLEQDPELKAMLHDEGRVDAILFGDNFHHERDLIANDGDDDEYVASLLSSLDGIYHYESWQPKIDSKIIIAFVGLYSLLPDDVQAVVFEEIFSFAPFVACLFTQSTINTAPRRFRSTLVLIVALGLILLLYIAIETSRWLLRKTARKPKKALYKVKHALEHPLDMKHHFAATESDSFNDDDNREET